MHDGVSEIYFLGSAWCHKMEKAEKASTQGCVHPCFTSTNWAASRLSLVPIRLPEPPAAVGKKHLQNAIKGPLANDQGFHTHTPQQGGRITVMNLSQIASLHDALASACWRNVSWDLASL